MRFLHDDVAPIVSFIGGRNLRLFDCDVLGGWTLHLVDGEALDAYSAESNRLYGLAPKHFFFATSDDIPPDFDLRASVARAEATVGEMALCAYFDGGIISVTKEAEQFQANARDASWWQLGRWPREQKT